MNKIILLNGVHVVENKNNVPFIGRVPVDLEIGDIFEDGNGNMNKITEKQIFENGSMVISFGGVANG